MSDSSYKGMAGKENAFTYRFYRGKVTSVNTIKSFSVGKYSYSSKYVPKGKGFIQTNYLSRTTKTGFKSFGNKVNAVKDL